MSRKSLLASVHIAKAQLKLDDDAYRDLIYGLFKQRSAALLNDAQLSQFVAHLNGLQKRAGLSFKGTRNERQIKKCEALWIELRKAGTVRDGSTQALDAFARNLTRVAGLRMASSTQLNTVIEALKDWLNRTRESTQ